MKVNEIVSLLKLSGINSKNIIIKKLENASDKELMELADSCLENLDIKQLMAMSRRIKERINLNNVKNYNCKR